MFRTAVLACALTLLAMSAAGCMARYGYCGPEGPTPSGLTASDLVGRWHGDPSGELLLRAGGTFTADWSDLDRVTDAPKAGGSPTVTGTWSLEHGPGSGDEDSRQLELVFPKALYDYDISGTRAAPVVYTYTDDPDLCAFHTLRR
ncbi:hypothetical protein [Streptomyces sp. VRA16 Mangrove soil]|uniref:hypothetical protein n=1 Tax=Streptomyces sp. VRA16 Mangrove soil TaxID=2817434 RepID=UPI001A9FEC23|nr:hypothetical protein [Streptomyces sp. VRA16 Mangrove soil]MBO1335519.1 hypothetical protein [Streptomyces sp. VRA16 Mangrove soil]